MDFKYLLKVFIVISVIFIIIELFISIKRRQSKPKKEEVRVKNIYFSGDDSSIQLTQWRNENREYEDEAKVDHLLISLLPVGLPSAWMKNDPYKDLLIKAGLDSMNNREIFEILKKKTYGEH